MRLGLVLQLVVLTVVTGRSVYNLDMGWRFKQIKTTTVATPPEERTAAAPPAECTDPYCQPDYNDQSWRTVNVPHDFVVEGTFNKSAVESSGYLPYGVAWYRKHFPRPSTGEEIAYLTFDGTQAHTAVYLNGVYLGGHASGYTPYRFYVAPLLKDENVLAVLVDATSPDGWWYDGGGIYRHVWLTTVPLVHIEPWGVYTPTAVVGDITNGSAAGTVSPVVEVRNNGTSPQEVSVVVSVAGVEGEGKATVPPGGLGEVQVDVLHIPTVRLWDIVSPNLYTITARVLVAGKEVDSTNLTIGFRRTHWDAEKGFFLNDRPTKVLGLANHQDFAGVGVAVPDSLQSHRIMKLKEMGANAWRTAHNAPTEALLDEADRLGFLVWDENHRNGQDAEMEILIRRDRNHPSIIIWSLCNERLCNTKDVTGDGKRLKAIVKRLDPAMGRPLSANDNSINGKDTFLDLQGFDYATGSYDEWHAAAPNVPAISSETSSALNDRGEYTNNATTGHVSGYDVNAPGWGQTAEVAWQGIMERSFIAGGFTWTGWDYKGEPTPYSWPDINSHFGTYDIAGFRKDRWYFYKQLFTPEEPLVHIFPHWNWEGECTGRCTSSSSGKTVEVWAYSNTDTVELMLNGKSLGVQPCTKYSHAKWMVPYTPGTLEGRGYRNGSATPIATSSVSTTGPPKKLAVSFMDGVGAKGLKADGSDVALIQVQILDDQGRVVPTASNVVTFTVKGEAVFIGSGNGDPASHTHDKSPTREAFHGVVLGVVQATLTSGSATVAVSSPGLEAAEIALRSSPFTPPYERL